VSETRLRHDEKSKKFSRVLRTLGGVSGGGLHPPYAFGGAASCEAPGRGFLVLFFKKEHPSFRFTFVKS
jgi:hypothetical protein